MVKAFERFAPGSATSLLAYNHRRTCTGNVVNPIFAEEQNSLASLQSPPIKEEEVYPLAVLAAPRSGMIAAPKLISSICGDPVTKKGT